MEAGDWEDENLDVMLDDIQNAYLIIRNDLTPPTKEDFEEHKQMHADHKKFMIEKYWINSMLEVIKNRKCREVNPLIEWYYATNQ